MNDAIILPDMYKGNMREQLYALPGNIRDAALNKLMEIDRRRAMYPMGFRSQQTEALTDAGATITAAAAIHHAQTRKIAAGHKNAQPERLAYAFELIEQFMAIDLDKPGYHPIDPTVDTEGFSGPGANGTPFTAAIRTATGISGLCWSKSVSLNGVEIRKSLPTHWQAHERTAYGNNTWGIGITRAEAIAKAKAMVPGSEKAAFEYQDKEWTQEELDEVVQNRSHMLGTIAFSRNLPRPTNHKALVRLILKDRELKRLTGDPYYQKFTGTPRAKDPTRRRASTDKPERPKEELQL